MVTPRLISILLRAQAQHLEPASVDNNQQMARGRIGGPKRHVEESEDDDSDESTEDEEEEEIEDEDDEEPKRAESRKSQKTTAGQGPRNQGYAKGKRQEVVKKQKERTKDSKERREEWESLDEMGAMAVCLRAGRVVHHTKKNPEFGNCDRCGGAGRAWHRCLGRSETGGHGGNTELEGKCNGIFRPIIPHNCGRKQIYFKAEFAAKLMGCDPLYPEATTEPGHFRRTTPQDGFGYSDGYDMVPRRIKTAMYDMWFRGLSYWSLCRKDTIRVIEETDGEIKLIGRIVLKGEPYPEVSTSGDDK